MTTHEFTDIVNIVCCSIASQSVPWWPLRLQWSGTVFGSMSLSWLWYVYLNYVSIVIFIPFLWAEEGVIQMSQLQINIPQHFSHTWSDSSPLWEKERKNPLYFSLSIHHRRLSNPEFINKSQSKTSAYDKRIAGSIHNGVSFSYPKNEIMSFAYKLQKLKIIISSKNKLDSDPHVENLVLNINR